MIDVVTTAIRRPELLDLAYRSYFGGGICNLPNLRIILNIDPISCGSSDQMVAIAHKYATEVVIRNSDEANFATAVNWAWAQVESPFFLHLEDDWLIRRPVDFEEWLKCLEADPNALQAVLLRKRARTEPRPFSFRPHLAKSEVIARVGSIPTDKNPEKFVAESLGPGVSIDFGLPYGFHDLGRKWAKAQHLKKAEGAAGLQINPQVKDWFTERPASIIGKIDYFCCHIRWRCSLLKVSLWQRLVRFRNSFLGRRTF